MTLFNDIKKADHIISYQQTNGRPPYVIHNKNKPERTSTVKHISRMKLKIISKSIPVYYAARYMLYIFIKQGKGFSDIIV